MLQGRLQLRRDRRAVPHLVRGAAGARSRPARYRNITGNTATALGFVAAAQRAGPAALPRQLPDHAGERHPARALDAASSSTSTPSRPRTRSPASARRSAPRSAARSAITTTSGPGMCLKAETDRPGGQRRAAARSSPTSSAAARRTGLPTKTEQADLLLAHVRPQRRVAGSDPRAAPRRPTASRTAFEAVRIAVTLHDAGHPPLRRLPRQRRRAVADPERRRAAGDPASSSAPIRKGYFPYLRDPETLARPWAIPGTPGLEHRIGGLEKEYLTGNVSYAPANHEQMVRVRARKIAGIAREIPPTEVHRAARRRPAGRRLGQHVRRDRKRRRASCAAEGHRVVARAPPLPEPAAGRPRRRPRGASSRCWCPR